MFETLLYFFVGILIGILASLFGIGGGFLIVPVLNMLGTNIHQAIGTSLASIPFTSLSAILAYSRQKKIDYKVGFFLAIPSIIGAFIGAWLSSYIPPIQLEMIFGFVLLIISIRMFKKGDVRVKSDIKTKTDRYLPLLSIGFFTGILSGMLGIGGGVINVPVLSYLCFPIHYAIATSNFVMFFTAIGGAVKHYFLGNVKTYLLIPLIPGLMIGAQFGAILAKKMKAEKLKKSFAIALALLALKMIVRV